MVQLRQESDDRDPANKPCGWRSGGERRAQAENSPDLSPSAGQWWDRADGQDP
jgi:hypothetical protein